MKSEKRDNLIDAECSSPDKEMEDNNIIKINVEDVSLQRSDASPSQAEVCGNLDGPMKINMEHIDSLSSIKRESPSEKSGKSDSPPEKEAILGEILKAHGATVDTLPAGQLQKLLSGILKFAKDSDNKKGEENKDLSEKMDEGCQEKKNQTLCKLYLDAEGVIKYVGDNAFAVFGRYDLQGFNFFNIMAGYNKTYYQQKFHENPLLGFKKQVTVLRYSLDHLNDELMADIVTSKLILMYSNVTKGEPRRVIGAKVISRKSSPSSTHAFRNKIQNGTIEAGMKAIKHLKELVTMKQVAHEELLQFQRQRQENASNSTSDM